MKKLILIAISLLLLSTQTVNAATNVPWDSTSYRAYALVDCCTGWVESDEQISSTAPVSASVSMDTNPEVISIHTIGDANSSITASQIDLYAWSEDFYVYASASFEGTFVAPSSGFNFAYPWYESDWSTSWLLIEDQTTSTTLVDQNLGFSTDNVFNVPVVIGNTINVSFGAYTYYEYGYTASYSMSVGEYTPPVVPEPISSTLFLIGGTLLGFRRVSRR